MSVAGAAGSALMSAKIDVMINTMAVTKQKTLKMAERRQNKGNEGPVGTDGSSKPSWTMSHVDSEAGNVVLNGLPILIPDLDCPIWLRNDRN